MKNISLTISPYNTGYAPPPLASALQAPASPSPKSQVTLNAHFDNEEAALSFARFVITNVMDYKDRS